MIYETRPRTLADVIRRVHESERVTNPFGSDAQTLRYAADQVKLPSLSLQLRRIANDLEVAREVPPLRS